MQILVKIIAYVLVARYFMFKWIREFPSHEPHIAELPASTEYWPYPRVEGWQDSKERPIGMCHQEMIVAAQKQMDAVERHRREMFERAYDKHGVSFTDREGIARERKKLVNGQMREEMYL